MNKITIEKAGTVETLTIPDAEIDAVMAELMERFGNRNGFVKGQHCFVLYDNGDILERSYSDYFAKYAERGRIFHTEAEAIAAKERRLAEQRLRTAYIEVTGGAERSTLHWSVVWDNDEWAGIWIGKNEGHPHPYRFATSEQAAAFGRDNGEDLMRMMSV